MKKFQKVTLVHTDHHVCNFCSILGPLQIIFWVRPCFCRYLDKLCFTFLFFLPTAAWGGSSFQDRWRRGWARRRRGGGGGRWRWSGGCGWPTPAWTSSRCGRHRRGQRRSATDRLFFTFFPRKKYTNFFPAKNEKKGSFLKVQWRF